MKKLLFICILIVFVISTKGQNIFQKTFGVTGSDFGSTGWSINQNTDGGYIITGSTSSFFDANVYVIRINASGDTLWTKTYGGSNTDGSYSIRQTLDNGFIMTGYTKSFGSGGFDIYLIKINNNGDTLWTKTYGGTGDDIGNEVQQTIDGGYIITGQTNSFGAGFSDVYLIKTDYIGNTLWTKTYGGINYDNGDFVQQTTDEGYIITGFTESFGAGNDDVYLIKTDSNGSIMWTKAYGGSGDDRGWSVQQTSDGGYIITGYTKSFEFGSIPSDVYLIKTDNSGVILWSKTYGGDEYDAGHSVKQTLDGGYIITGESTDFGSSTRNVYLIKTDSNGNILWTNNFGGGNIVQDGSWDVQQTLDKGYIITGFTENNVFLIKTDSLGNECKSLYGYTITSVTNPTTITNNTSTLGGTGGIMTNTTTIVNSTTTIDSVWCQSGSVNINSQLSTFNKHVNIYPNPFTSSTTLIINNLDSKDYNLKIINLLGKELKEFSFTSNTLTIRKENLKNGIYFYKVSDNENNILETGKLIVQ